MEDGMAEEIWLHLEEWIAVGALIFEALAAFIIIIATIVATLLYLRAFVQRSAGLEDYEQYKVRLGRALLLGLEVLVAADIVRTVVLEPTLTNIAILGLLVLIRTFLSWSLVVEIEHRWPWQKHEQPVPAHASGRAGATAPEEGGLPHG
jgi:uncharacterized membrane protein